MGGTIPSYARPFVSLTAAVTRPGPILLNHEASKIVVPQGSTVEVPLRVVRTVEEKKTYKLTALSPPDRPERGRVGAWRVRHVRHRQAHGGGRRASRAR